MKVLFVSGLTGYGIGGVRTEEIHLIGGAIRHGSEVAFCSDVLPEEIRATRHFKLDYPPGEKAPEQLNRALSDFNPDIVHVTGGGIRFLQVCDGRFGKTPWIFTCHNLPPAEKIFSHLFASNRLHYAVRNMLTLPSVWTWRRHLKTAGFRRVICHSATVAARLTRAGCPPHKLVQIPTGTEMPELAIKPDPAQPSPFPAGAWPKMLTVAGLTFHKGQLDAVRMAARLLREFPKLSYLLIGMSRDKSYRAYLEKMIRQTGLAGHVSIIQAAPEALKFAALRDADLYLQPSHEEGYCLGFLEALMMVPRAIGTDTGAIAAMAEGHTAARVVKVGEVQAMEHAATELLKETISPETIVQRRQSLVRKYSWEAYLNSHLAAYRDALGSAG